MDIRLNSLSPNSITSLSSPASANKSDVNASFQQTLQDTFDKINQMQLRSAELKRQFAAGETDDLVQVITASEEASVALQLAVHVRNKVIEAYQEVMRMQV